MSFKKAITQINQCGALLVFPIKNKKEPLSLWSQFYPRTQMVWEWDADADNRVAKMWHLMKELSSSSEVVYSKWYQGRATFFSKELFIAMMAIAKSTENQNLSRAAKTLFESLEVESPLSTKVLKKQAELQGKFNEPVYSKGMKELYNKFLIVAYGEVDDGAFPSLAVGATKNLFEDLWTGSKKMPMVKARQILEKHMPTGSALRKYFDKTVSTQTNG